MKEFLDLNNKFYKDGDTYIYKPKLLMMLIFSLSYIAILYMAIRSFLIMYFRNDKLIDCILCFVIGVHTCIFIFKIVLDSFLSITIDKNGCVLSWLFYKKTISWNDFKVIKYESYENYKHRMGGRHSSPFPYKGCVIFSLCDLKKPIQRDPIMYLKKRFSWFYINFYDEKDIRKEMKYDPYKFVFDEKEFNEFINKINLQIQDYPN